jgi:hypothetical protein
MYCSGYREKLRDRYAVKALDWGKGEAAERLVVLGIERSGEADGRLYTWNREKWRGW